MLMKVFYILFILIFCGCTNLQTREDIQNNTSQDKPVHIRKPSLKTRVTDIENNMRTLNGRLESLEHQIQKPSKSDPSQEVLEELRSLKTELSGMSKRIKALEKNLFIAAQTSPNAFLYLEGEDLFKKKQWQNAILTYEKYRSENPDGKYWADATLKIATSFERLELIEEAKAFYKELTDKKPKSLEARQANNRLKQLK